MKDVAAVVLNFFYDISNNSYLAVSLVAIVALLFNSALRRVNMRNLGLQNKMEPEIKSIHDKYGYNNPKSQAKISELINNYHYVVYASIFLSLLQLLEGWAFMSGFKSNVIYAIMTSSEKVPMHRSIYSLWHEEGNGWIYCTVALIVAMILQRVNDAIIEKNLIGDQVLADYIVLAFIIVACIFIPAYISVYWFTTEIIELVLTIKELHRPTELHFKESNLKPNKKKNGK